MRYVLAILIMFACHEAKAACVTNLTLTGQLQTHCK